MNNEEKILAMLEQINDRQSKTETLLVAVQAELTDVKNDLAEVQSTVMRIENDHGKKLDALYDGYQFNREGILSIKEEVSRHEEVILKRVR